MKFDLYYDELEPYIYIYIIYKMIKGLVLIIFNFQTV